MTPKEKADEICRKMLYEMEWHENVSLLKTQAKLCALIAVNEMTKYIPNIYHNDIYKEKYWKKVKKEIRKL
jgi:hypothetical protein